MAAILHAEFKGWWDYKFSPKNSKWLQSNISETEKKVSAIVRILDDYADSFARRADMYYKRRPELLLLVKELYGAYRALAERYDVAAGALRVATRSLADAFPNQTPPSLSLPDESPSTPLSEPQTPDMPPPARSLFDTDQLHNDKIGNSPNVHKKNSEGLKQVNDLFQGEPKARKGLSFQADKAQKTKHEDGVGLEMASLQRDIFHLSEETKRLKDQVLAEAERANKAEGELLTLKGNILHFSFEEDAAYIECQSQSKRLMNVESDLGQAHSDLVRLREVEKLSQEQKLEVELLENKVELQVMELEQLTEKLKEVEKSKLDSVENVEKLTEQNFSSEIRKLQGKISALEGRTEKLKGEIQGLQEKLHEMVSDLSLSEEENKCLIEKLQETEATVSDPQIEIELLRNERENLEAEIKTLIGSIFKLKPEKEGVQRDFNQLKLEMAIEADMLRNAEKLNLVQQSELELLQVRLKSQEDYRELVREIGELNKQNITPEETLRELLRDLSSLKETNEKLEKEVVHLREKETLQRDISLQIQDTCDLSNKLQILTAQTEAAIKVNAVLKEAFTKYEIERGILSEKNAVLEKELSDTIVELKLLRERVSELEISEESLSNKVSLHVSEKADLASYLSEIYEKNSALENSLYDASEKLKASEASCQSLISQKSGLVVEIQGLQEKLHEMVSDLSLSEEENKCLIMKLQETETTISDPQIEIELLRNERDNLEAEVKTLRGSIFKLKSEKEGVQRDFNQLKLEIAIEADMLRNAEKMNLAQQSELELLQVRFKSQEEDYSELVREIGELNEQKITSEETLRELFRDISSFKQTKDKLEKEGGVHLIEKETLQRDLSLQIQETCYLSNKLQILIAQIEIVIKVNAVLEEAFTKYVLESGSVSEKNAVLEKQLSNAAVELRRIVQVSEMSDHSFYFSEIYEKNYKLVSFLFDVGEQLKAPAEASCQSLISQKSELIAERDDLFSQVDNITVAMKNLEEKHLALSDERDLRNNLKELELLLSAKTTECENAVRSHEMNVTTLGDQISEHISKNTALVSEIKALNHTIEAISTKNSQLESSLSDINAEMEDMKKKLKDREEICQLLIHQKSLSNSEKNDLLFQVLNLSFAIPFKRPVRCVCGTRILPLE